MFLIDLGVQAALYACKYFLKRIGLFLWTEFCRYHNKKVFVVSESKYGRRLTGTAIRIGFPPGIPCNSSLYTLHTKTATKYSFKDA